MRLEITTGQPVDVVDVTDRVAEALPADAGGVWTAFVAHTTAGICLNESEPRLVADIEAFVGTLSDPEGWRHDELDGNADAHLRSMLLGRSVQFPVAGGTPELGTWQSVLLVDCDGPRTRTVRLLAP